MGVPVVDLISNALSGKPTSVGTGAQDQSPMTKVTPADIASTQAIRNSPEFQAALKAQRARQAAPAGPPFGYGR